MCRMVGQPVAEVVISSAKRSDWDWLLHPQDESGVIAYNFMVYDEYVMDKSDEK